MNTENKLPRAIFFDLDGTLADTAPDLAAAANLMRTSRNLPPAPYENLRSVASSGGRGLLKVAFDINPEDGIYAEYMEEFLNNYQAALANKSKLFNGIRNVLNELSRRGIYWGVVTNKYARFTELLIPQIDLGDSGCVISGDTTPYSKPHPEPLFEAARRVGVNPQECWYAGDDARDIEAGRLAGMKTIAVLWGYGGEKEPYNWNADWVVSTPSDIIGLLE